MMDNGSNSIIIQVTRYDGNDLRVHSSGVPKVRLQLGILFVSIVLSCVSCDDILKHLGLSAFVVSEWHNG